MLRGFESGSDAKAQRRLLATTGASALMYGVLGVLALTFAGRAAPAMDAPPVDVTFRPPPPPAPVPVQPAAPPKNVPVKKTSAVKAPRPLVIPKAIPAAKPAEADPSEAVLEVVEGAGGGGIDNPPVPPPAPPPPPARRQEPVNLPEAATPPRESPENAPPKYPTEAREKGLEGQVILKIVISESGEVVKVEVLRGVEPFVAAAVTAVRTWRYSPAEVAGRPISVFRIVKMPFRISK